MRKELCEALKVIQDECFDNADCETCAFAGTGLEKKHCPLTAFSSPAYWNLEKNETPKDVYMTPRRLFKWALRKGMADSPLCVDARGEVFNDTFTENSLEILVVSEENKEEKVIRINV